MQFDLKKKKQGEIEFGIIFGGIVLLAILAARFLPVLAVAPSCVFRTLTGFPCPACGSTRSLVHLAHGDIVHAFVMNPLTATCMFFAVVYLFYSVLSRVFAVPRVRFVLTDREKDGIRGAAVLILLLNWVYLVFSL